MTRQNMQLEIFPGRCAIMEWKACLQVLRILVHRRRQKRSYVPIFGFALFGVHQSTDQVYPRLRINFDN